MKYLDLFPHPILISSSSKEGFQSYLNDDLTKRWTGEPTAINSSQRAAAVKFAAQDTKVKSVRSN